MGKKTSHLAAPEHPAYIWVWVVNLKLPPVEVCVCVCVTMAGFQMAVPQPVSRNKDKLCPMNRNVLFIELVFASVQTLSTPCRFSEHEKKKKKRS